MATADTSLQQRRSRPSSEGRLARGILSDVDIAAATLADMAPAMSFFFGFATIVVTGAKPSTKVAAVVFVFQFLLLLVVAIALLVEHSGHINGQPFDPSNLHRGFSGLSLGFPLAIYLFVGWENSAALAEEHHDPRAGVTRAVFSSILVVGVLYVFLS